MLVPSTAPDTVHQSRLYDGKPTPCDCWKCGRMPNEPRPPMLIDGTWIDCPGCGPVIVQDLLDAEDRYALRRDVHDLLGEDKRKGTRGGGGGSNGSRKPRKPTPRGEFRPEQEAVCFGVFNGREGGHVKVKRFATATEPVDLIMSETTRAEAMLECRLRGGYEKPFPFSALVREALEAHAARLTEAPPMFNRDTERTKPLRMMLYPQEAQALGIACEAYDRTKGEVADACLLLYLSPAEEPEA